MKQNSNPHQDVPRETVICASCRKGNISLKYAEITDFAISNEKFSIYECQNCHILFTHPFPAELNRYYDSPEYISHSESKTGIVNKLYHYIQKANLRYKYRIAEKFSTGKKWADYGAGAGSYCEYCHTQGISITAYEPNALAREKSKNKGIKTYDITSFNQTSERYNCITLWHVLEHIRDLTSVLSTLYEKLDANGILILALPNHESYDSNHYGKYWAAWDVPRHLWHFNGDALKRLATKAGFQIKDIRPLYFDSFYVSALSEKYKKGWLPLALLTGIISNLKGILKTKSYSSIIYILEKQH